MGIRENKVEKYLDDQVQSRFPGSLTRKWTSPGRDGVPDRIVIFNTVPLATVYFVEVKTDDGKLSSCQSREHDRLKAAMAQVTTVYGKQGVDEFLNKMQQQFNVRNFY